MRDEYVNEHREILGRLQSGEDFSLIYDRFRRIWDERGIESISQAALYFAGVYKPSK